MQPTTVLLLGLLACLLGLRFLRHNGFAPVATTKGLQPADLDLAARQYSEHDSGRRQRDTAWCNVWLLRVPAPALSVTRDSQIGVDGRTRHDAISRQDSPQEAIPSKATPSEAKGTSTETAAQCRVAVILLATLALWMTDRLHCINPAWIGIVTATILLLPRIGVVAPKSFNTEVDFGMVLFVAAALGLGLRALVNQSGLGKIVGHTMLQMLPLVPGAGALNFFHSPRCPP